MQYKTHTELVHELCGICDQCNVRFKNQSSNSTSCIDNALHLLVVVLGRVYLRTSSDVFIFNVALHFEGLF